MSQLLENQVDIIFKDPQSLANGSHPTVFHEFLQGKGPVLSKEALLDESISFLFAGTDTSSDALSVGTLYILSDPHVYAKLKQELLQAWPVLEDRPRYEALESLPYLVRRSVPYASAVHLHFRTFNREPLSKSL